MSKTLPEPLGGNEMPRFGGPATMMRLPTRETASAGWMRVSWAYRLTSGHRTEAVPVSDRGKYVRNPVCCGRIIWGRGRRRSIPWPSRISVT